MNIRAIQHDDLSRDVIFSYPPQKIVSLCPSITETLFAIGAGELLVGRTDYCVHPQTKIRKIPAVGGTKNFRIDEIVALNPDLIIAEKEENPKNKILKLHDQIPVFVFSVESFNDALAMIAKLGELTGKEKESYDLLNRVRHAFEDIRPEGTQTAAYLIWEKPLMAAGNNTFINAMMEKAGFRNIFAERPERYPKITVRDLMDKKPETLILSTEPCTYTEADVKRYRQLLPNTNVILINGELFSWYGARMLKAAEFIQHFLSTGETP